MMHPFKRTPSDYHITTLIHIIDCSDRTYKLLRALDLDSQRLTQSSQAIQSALDSTNTLFHASNLQ